MRLEAGQLVRLNSDIGKHKMEKYSMLLKSLKIWLYLKIY